MQKSDLVKGDNLDIIIFKVSRPIHSLREGDNCFGIMTLGEAHQKKG